MICCLRDEVGTKVIWLLQNPNNYLRLVKIHRFPQATPQLISKVILTFEMDFRLLLFLQESCILT